ncbi:MAG: MBL fold metallo-hydrolase [Nitrososphaerales archaeon]
MNQSEHPKIEKVSTAVLRLGPLGLPKVLCSYLIVDRKISIVDCGPSAVIEELLELVKQCGVSASEIDNLLLTHIHIDHAGGTGELVEKCPQVRVFVPKRGFQHLVDPSVLNPSARAILGDKLFGYWGAAKPVTESKVHSMETEETVDLGGDSVRFIEARGHAPHQDVLLLQNSKVLFAADALGIHDDKNSELHSPTTPPPSFNMDQQLEDFQTIEKIEPRLLCFPHFRSLTPTKEFYSETRSLYKKWERIIGSYLEEKRVAGNSLAQSDIDRIFSRLQLEYPAYQNIPENLEHQMKRVDIAGLAQWFDFKARHV